MSYDFSQLQQLLQQAGLDQAKAAIGAAIALAESGGNPGAVGDQGTSMGLWQIHLPAHPDVSQACALDPACAAAAAVRISQGGTNWNPWSTFTSGAYQAYLSGEQAIAAAVNWVITLRFGQSGPGGTEVGTDIGIPVGTGIVTPFSGTVLTEDKGKQAWGKRLLVKIDSGPLAGWTYAIGHLTNFTVSAGQHVSAGDLVGHSGGAVSDPSSGESTGPHVEFQFLNQSGTFMNPEQVLASLGLGFGQLLTGAIGGFGLPNPLDGVPQAIAGVQQAFSDAVLRGLYMAVGLGLIWFGLLLLIIGSIPWKQVMGGAATAAAPEASAVTSAAGGAAA